MLGTVLFSHPGKMLVKAIFPGDFGRLWPVVHFLELAEGLINDRFDVAASPHYAPFLLFVVNFSETVVLEGIPDQPHFKSVVKFEIQVFIWRLVRTYAHRIYVGPKEHVLFLKFTIDCRGLLCPEFICFINFTLGLYRLLGNIRLKFLLF